MSKIVRTDSTNTDFIALVKHLDKYLAQCDGEEHDFYDQYNKLDKIKNVILFYENAKAVGCGAIKEYEPGIMEVKRMYVSSDYRNKGYACIILKELEKWALELGCQQCILETGKRQYAAVAFYKKNKYLFIPNFEPYVKMENSLCFEKKLF